MKEKERFSDFILRLSAILLINQNGSRFILMKQKKF
jgi:hypothetical protein